MPAKTRHHTVAVPLMLHLQHHPLVRLIRSIYRLRHHSIQPRPLKSLEPVRRHTLVPSRGGHMHRRPRMAKHLFQSLPPHVKRNLAQILLPHPKQIKNTTEAGLSSASIFTRDAAG